VKDVFRHDKTRDGESKEKRASPKDEGLSVVFHLMPNVIQSLMNVWKKFQDHSRLLMTTTVRGFKDIEKEESAAFLSFRSMCPTHTCAPSTLLYSVAASNCHHHVCSLCQLLW
jgi:hypothetical protein